MILSDWAITKNANSATLTGVPAQGPQDIAMPWGVEDLSRPERYAKLMNAGIDQIGGEDDPQPMLDAIEQGLVSMARIDDAARRVLEQKFALGLFENPFVDEALVDAVVGCAEHVALAQRVQRASLVALGGGDVSLRSGDRVYAPDLDAAVLSARGFTPVEEPSDATVAVLRMHTPFEILHPNFFFGSMMHEGSLEFKSDDPQVVRLREVAAQVPTIAVIFCDRPPTVGLVDELASRLVAEYGVSDDVIVDALRDGEQLTGVAPMTRPLSMAEVESHPGDQHDGWALS
jgi:beta-glucosidase